MKTYWLQVKESRTPVPRIGNSVPPAHIMERKTEPKQSTSHTNPPKEAGRTVVYSPITFQDVARRSIVNSPEKANTRGTLNHLCHSQHAVLEKKCITRKIVPHFSR